MQHCTVTKSTTFNTASSSIATRNVGQCPTWWRPAEYRWRPLFNAAKFSWRPILECRAVTLPRHDTGWNLQACPKLTKRSQPLVGQSSPYCGDMWRRYCCLTGFFLIVDTCLSCEDIAQQVMWWYPDGDFLRFFWVPYFQRAVCSTFQSSIVNSH